MKRNFLTETRLSGALMGALMMTLPATMSGQENAGKYDFRSHMFVQAQGGLHIPLSSGSKSDMMQPNFGANVGVWLAPSLGLRLGVDGTKSSVRLNNEYYKFNYFTINWDVLLNLSPLFVKGNNPSTNVYLVGGIGLTHSGDKNFPSNLVASQHVGVAHNLRAGIGMEYRVAKPLSLSVEYRINSTDDEFNGVINNKDDYYSSLLLGLSYNFGYNKSLYHEPEDIVPLMPTNALSLYEQKEEGVNSRMSLYMKRLAGESKADFLARTSDELIQSKRLEYSKEISTSMAGNRIKTNMTDLQYNSAAGLLGVKFTDMPSITLKVPREDVAGIKDMKELQFSNTVYDLYPGDKFEVLYTDVLNPATGKTYTYIKQRDVQFVQSDGYLPLRTVQQDITNSARLAQLRDRTMAEAKDKKVLSDNTTITVATELIPKGEGKADYKVSYTYSVKEGFSTKEDFAPGKYDADKSPASTAMLSIINQSMKEDFAEQIKAGKTVTIKYTGAADSSPIRGKIAYNGRYGDIKDQAVSINGKPSTLTITKASGITSNEQLSLVRAKSVRDYIHQNVEGLKDLKVSDEYYLEVSSDEGSQFRRVAVEFLFHDAF